METNVLGVLNSVQPVLPRMMARGAGQIGIVSSIAAFIPLPDAPSYSASKSAILIMVLRCERHCATRGRCQRYLPGLCQDADDGAGIRPEAVLRCRLRRPPTNRSRSWSETARSLLFRSGSLLSRALADFCPTACGDGRSSHSASRSGRGSYPISGSGPAEATGERKHYGIRRSMELSFSRKMQRSTERCRNDDYRLHSLPTRSFPARRL